MILFKPDMAQAILEGRKTVMGRYAGKRQRSEEEWEMPSWRGEI